MKIDQQHIITLLQSFDRLRNINNDQYEINQLISYTALLAMKLRLGHNRPKIVGLIGCTGAGKSTLFNSFTNARTSITGWKAHNTRGPILFSKPEFENSISQLEAELGSILLPTFDRKYITNINEDSTLGSSDTLYWIINQNHLFTDMVLVDLPDINTTKSRAERFIALEVLPWLDQVIFVVDEETLYHKDYEEAVALSKSLNQSRLAVINNRGKDRIVLDHPDFQECKRFFGVERLHVLPIIQSGPIFTTEPEFADLKQDLLEHSLAPAEPLNQLVSPIAQNIIHECQRRQELFQSVEIELNHRVSQYIAKQKPIGFDKILSDEVLSVLQHLGLKRFAITNIIQLFKNFKDTGSIRRSFNLAFGNKRDDLLNNIISLDKDKFKEVMSNRLKDIAEEMQKTIRKNSHHKELFEIVPELRHFTIPMDEDFSQKLNSIIDSFESRCQEVLQSDTLKSSVKNDPLVALGVIVILVIDIFTIPFFGSFILVPSVLKLLPLGKFDEIKKDFQRETKQLIQHKIHQQTYKIQDIHSQHTLRETDPIYKALKSFTS